MNITLFGGSFNPPHLGHALIIQEFLASGLTDELWVLPNNIHSFGKNLAPANHRLTMCNLLIDFLIKTENRTLTTDQLKLCPIEIDLNLSGKTIDTIKALQENVSYLINQKIQTFDQSIKHQTLNIKYSFLMGSDQLPKFKLWDNYQELLNQMDFWVYPRDGYLMEPLMHGMKPFIHDNQTITNFSSTLIRNRLVKHQNVSLILPESIEKYIIKSRLYEE